MKRKDIGNIFCAAALLLLLSACCHPQDTGGTEAAVCVDRGDLVGHDRHIRERYAVSAFKLGAKLCEVTFDPPSHMSGEEFDEWQRDKRSLTQGCTALMPAGSEFYAVEGDGRSIAARSDGKYYLYPRSD